LFTYTPLGVGLAANPVALEVLRAAAKPARRTTVRTQRPAAAEDLGWFGRNGLVLTSLFAWVLALLSGAAAAIPLPSTSQQGSVMLFGAWLFVALVCTMGAARRQARTHNLAHSSSRQSAYNV
jgi:hypothetical protein